MLAESEYSSTENPSSRSVSAAQLRANRKNARSSTGPRSVDGKRRSSRNAIKHAIFCKEMLLEYEEAEHFEMIQNVVIEQLNPQNEMELLLAERMIRAQ